MIRIRHYPRKTIARLLSRPTCLHHSGDCGGKTSQRVIMVRKAPIFFRSPALVKPHQVGEAHIREKTVVILATWSDCDGRPYERRKLSAYMYIEEAHVARAVSICTCTCTCMSICRFELIATSRTRMVSTRVAPGIKLRGGGVHIAESNINYIQ